MSMLGHVALGVVVARLVTPGDRISRRLRIRMLMLAGLAVLPDIDLVVQAIAPSVAAFSHRGASHSFAFAIVAGTAVGIATVRRGVRRAVSYGFVVTGVLASHGVLDWLGQSDVGVRLLWPISDARMLAPWTFLPNPPSWPAVVSINGLTALAVEFTVFLPFWLYAFVPRRR